MADKKVITAKASYNGHNIKASSDIELKLKFSQEELVNILQLVEAIGYNIEIVALIEDLDEKEELVKQKIRLGTFTYWNQKIDNDGESTITLRSNSSDADLEALNLIIISDELIPMKFKII